MSARRQYALIAPVVPEHAEHKTAAAVLRMEIAREGHVSEHGVCWFSIDMAYGHDPGSAAVPAIRAARGVVAGVPDIIVLYQGRAFWCEMKSRDGVLSGDQRSLAATLLLSGCRIGIARDVAEVLACLDTWEIPRKRRIKVAA
ncbi:MAG TPA: hypothetical protein VGI78_11825 [Acetobacteraceae bacterium]|jgi:hypothetical protein